MKMLGVDYGSKHVGIALSDDGGNIAFPHEVVDRRDALDTVVRLVAERQVKAVVVGESRDGNGRRNTIATAVDEFAEVLRLKLAIPVVFEQEGFTTWHARQQAPLRRGILSRPRRIPGNNRVDASAAALILQRYLDRGTLPTNNP
jgi:putative Holliday junction resolvase